MSPDSFLRCSRLHVTPNSGCDSTTDTKQTLTQQWAQGLWHATRSQCTKETIHFALPAAILKIQGRQTSEMDLMTTVTIHPWGSNFDHFYSTTDRVFKRGYNDLRMVLNTHQKFLYKINTDQERQIVCPFHSASSSCCDLAHFKKFPLTATLKHWKLKMHHIAPEQQTIGFF